MWLSFNNPHSPYHLPPVELLHSDAKYLDPDATPTRDFAFADIFSPWREPSSAIRNASHKLVDIEGTEELYNLLDDPYEYNNLLADELSADDKRHYEELKSRVTALFASELMSRRRCTRWR